MDGAHLRGHQHWPLRPRLVNQRLPFSLHRLCRPRSPRLLRLSEPQRKSPSRSLCFHGKPCKLAVGSIENIVAHGTVYEKIKPNEAIHMVPLGESNVRVSIEVVIQKDALLPIPISDEMLIVGEAVRFFVAWPKNLVLVGDEGVSINVECRKYQVSIQSFVSLVEHIKYDEAIDIPLEKDIFGVEINIQLQKVDMEYICHVKELSVTCIMLYISHLHQVLKVSNWRKQFVFVNPCIVSGKTMDGEKSKSVLLARRLEEAMLEQLILIPYNIGYHWILLVIDLALMIVYLLDPINSKINTSLEIVINIALKIYETTQRRRRTNPVWNVVQSPQQPTNVECGFYVMRYIEDLIRDQSILRKQNIH
ncbi:hypothetical protein HYC85_017847 [Camellia sinensis]|uniref:Ubiquitin-like protease family profile domain-containing protein n=1 Tax=Camellia sinensis TaxID=4442 RepID=A0A7J7GSU6_CAMSI|nr:hypothetical protein HYC85_017847 [Camellia sinensis]